MEKDRANTRVSPAGTPPWHVPSWYTVLWLFMTVCVTLVTAFFATGWRSPSYAALFWIIAVLLLLRRRAGLYMGAAVLLPPVGVYGFQQIRRIWFILKNGGMEPVDGMGSPMAFLIGWIFESVLLLPFVAAFIACVVFILRFHRDKSGLSLAPK